MLEVEGDVALAALTATERSDEVVAAHAVAAHGLDLDHVGAEVTEDHGAERPGEVLTEVEDAKPFERAAHRPSTSSLCSPARGCGPRTMPGVFSRKTVMPICVVAPTSGSTTSTTE